MQNKTSEKGQCTHLGGLEGSCRRKVVDLAFRAHQLLSFFGSHFWSPVTVFVSIREHLPCPAPAGKEDANATWQSHNSKPSGWT